MGQGLSAKTGLAELRLKEGEEMKDGNFISFSNLIVFAVISFLIFLLRKRLCSSESRWFYFNDVNTVVYLCF